MKRTRLIVCLLGSAALAAGLAARESVGNVASDMVAAGQKFLTGLRKEQQGQATIPFDDKERLNWHYIPRERKGLPYKSMTSQERELANSLMATGLSQEGLQKAQGIQRLEDVLRAESGSSMRDPGLYYVSIFGTPDEKRDWGWRMEGHHLSLNFTLRGGQVVSTTPLFLGANPATVHEGPQKGTRVLAKEEDLGRALLHSFSGTLRDKVMINVSAPADIVTGASHRAQM